MSRLVFDGTKHTLTFFDKDNVQVGGPWHANNVIDSSIKNMRFLPNHEYTILDRHHPYTHGKAMDDKKILRDSAEGSFGKFGIIRLNPFKHKGVSHSGVGIHSGRHSKGGADHATHGCIRTSDAVMEAIVRYIRKDPLTTLTVRHNHDQHNKHPKHKGDAHHHSHPAKPSAVGAGQAPIEV